MITDTRHDDMIAKLKRNVSAVEQEYLDDLKRKFPNMSRELRQQMLERMINNLGV